MSTAAPPPSDPFGQAPAAPTGQFGQPAPQQPAPASSGPAAQQPGRPAPGRDLGADLSASMSWAWKTFTRNLGAFAVPAVVYGLIWASLVIAAVVVGMILMFSAMNVDPNAAPGEGVTIDWGRYIGSMAVMYGGALVASFPLIFWQTGITRAGRAVIDGRRPGIGEGFSGTGRMLLTALLMTVLTVIGSLLFVIPGMIVAVLGMLAIPAAARGAGPVDAIKESVALVKANLGTAIVTLLVAGAISSAVGMTVVGVLVAMPIQMLMFEALYERLRGNELPEPAAA